MNSMKKFCLLSCFIFFTLSGVATEVTVDGVKYLIDEVSRTAAIGNGIVATKGAKDLVIPSSFLYEDVSYTVTSISDYAFISNSSIQTVKIPSSVKSIGKEAFWCDSYLSSVEIPESVTSIGKSAFSFTGIKSIVIPGNVTSLDFTFSDCHELEEVTLPNSVLSLDNTFDNCFSLKTITLPTSITSLNGTFGNCGKLTTVTLPSSLKTLNKSFRGCTSLSSITIPSSVETIDDNAFAGCTSLHSIDIPSSVNKLGDVVFQESGLYSITIPSTVTSIGMGCFQNCASLSSVTINNNIISTYEFMGCTSIVNINIPDGIDIGEGAFQNCSGIQTLSLNTGNALIHKSAFKGCMGLKSLTLTANYIGESAFEDCYSLKTITFNNRPNGIEDKAFYGCINLQNVNCTNANATYWNQVNNGNGIPENMFPQNPSCQTLYLPNSAVDELRLSYKMSKFFTLFIPLDDGHGTISDIGIQYDGNYVYTINKNNHTADITSLKSRFSECLPLTGKIDIPSNVYHAGGDDFNGNYTVTFVDKFNDDITSVTIPNTITSIGTDAFANCSNLTTAYLNCTTPPDTYMPFANNVNIYINDGTSTATVYNKFKKNPKWSDYTAKMLRYYETSETPFGYSTLYLPFETVIPDGTTAYYARLIEGNQITLSPVSGTLPAQTASVIVSTPGPDRYKFVETIASSPAISNNKLIGTADGVTVTANSVMTLSNYNGIVGFYTYTGTSIGANKAYINKANDAKSYSILIDNDTTTGISVPQSFGVDKSNDSYYDLQGRKVIAPQKGIYIKNGKKVIF